MLEGFKESFSDDPQMEDIEAETRRDFIKTLVAGTVATGVFAAIPNASAFSISSEDPIQFFNSTSSNPNMEVKASGETDLKGNNLVNTNRVEASEVNLSDSTSNGKTIVYDKELDTLVVVDE